MDQIFPIYPFRGAKEMGQQLQALASSPEDPGSIPSTRELTTVCNSCFKGFDTRTQTYMQININAHETKIIFLKRKNIYAFRNSANYEK